ncbi:MAG: NUDIX domain-containing protein [Candidatus Omnitrophica bacterium]|nr:NUDIX domain-containing protein [Candidatus Omnitrophota bacterium]
MNEKPYKLATRVVINDKLGRCLLLKRSAISKSNAGKWEFPGGKVDEGESFDAAMRREVTEETGLEVSFRRVVGAIEIEMPNFKVAQIILEADAESGAVILSSEHDEYVWVKPQDLLNMDLSPYLVSFIKDYIKVIISKQKLPSSGEFL